MNFEVFRKPAYIWAVVGIVILVIILFTATNKTSEEGNLPISEDVAKEQAIEEPADSVPSAQKDPSPSENRLSYEQAVKNYQGYRIQFGPTCKATPSQMTVKTGTEVMFDNRSAVTQTISFDDQSFEIAAFNFTVVNLFTAAPVLPYTVILHCGQSKNVAQVYLQN